ncbi:hypothetical protein ACFFK0_28580 [Paenibacillus chartarius]|uniref:Uncharacterized protein n=1 Tax=Paenibacillus chartarius TaxID=747481 RepID=A0ABV6DUM4_9BACL
MSVMTIIERLQEHVPELNPVHIWNEELEREIAALPENKEPFAALKSGLHLWNGSLDASHSLSQELETPLGSYWHGIMHRMEGDYGNANYWFARAGKHSFHLELQKAAAAHLTAYVNEGRRNEPIGLLGKLEALQHAPVWTPATFTAAVELCVHSPGSAARSVLEQIQYEEIKLLVMYCKELSGYGGK